MSTVRPPPRTRSVAHRASAICRIVVFINRHPVVALVDSGASCSAISSSVVATLPHGEPTDCPSTTATASLSTPLSFRGVVSLSTSPPSPPLLHSFRVSDDLSTGVILGWDWLLAVKAGLDGANNCLWVDGRAFDLLNSPPSPLFASISCDPNIDERMRRRDQLLANFPSLTQPTLGRTNAISFSIEHSPHCPLLNVSNC